MLSYGDYLFGLAQKYKPTSVIIDS